MQVYHVIVGQLFPQSANRIRGMSRELALPIAVVVFITAKTREKIDTQILVTADS
jgi:hypothetical protein